jgi:hypothetical protein
MSLPKLKIEPSYVRAELNELKEYAKLLLDHTIDKTSSENKIDSLQTPTGKRRLKHPFTYGKDSHDNIPTPRVDISKYILDSAEHKSDTKSPSKGKSKRRHDYTLPDIKKSHGIHPLHEKNSKTPLPSINKKGGKRRTRKNKSKHRKTISKK